MTWRVVLAAGWLLLAGSAAPAAASQPDLAERAARARAAMEARRFDEAAALYADLVRRVPDNPGLRLNLGLALHSAGQFERAAAELARAVEQDPGLMPAWLMLGLAYLKLGAPAWAIGPLERVLAAEPANRVARLELADAYLQLRRFEEAARHFDALTAADPASPQAWLGLGRSYASIARDAFERLEEKAPGSAYWAALLARSRASQQQYRSAFHLYRQALAAEPNLRGAHAALAEIYQRTDRPEWAAEEERRERALPPPDCTRDPLECEFVQGRLKELLERLTAADTPSALYWRSLAASDLALAAFARLEALPPSPQIHVLRAEGYGLRGLHDLAIKEWQQASTHAPGDRRLREGLALAHWRNQDYAVARPLLEELIAADSESAALRHALGDTLLQLQMPDAAIPHLERAVALDGSLTPARTSLARAYARLGRWEAAVPHLEATVDADDDGSLHLLLARAYAASGRQADSARLLEISQQQAQAAAARRTQISDEHAITPPPPQHEQ